MLVLFPWWAKSLWSYQSSALSRCSFWQIWLCWSHAWEKLSDDFKTYCEVLGRMIMDSTYYLGKWFACLSRKATSGSNPFRLRGRQSLPSMLLDSFFNLIACGVGWWGLDIKYRVRRMRSKLLVDAPFYGRRFPIGHQQFYLRSNGWIRMWPRWI